MVLAAVMTTGAVTVIEEVIMVLAAVVTTGAVTVIEEVIVVLCWKQGV